MCTIDIARSLLFHLRYAGPSKSTSRRGAGRSSAPLSVVFVSVSLVFMAVYIFDNALVGLLSKQGCVDLCRQSL